MPGDHIALNQLSHSTRKSPHDGCRLSLDRSYSGWIWFGRNGVNGEGLEKVHRASHMNGSMGSESYFKTLPCCPGQPRCTPFPCPHTRTPTPTPTRQSLTGEAFLQVQGYCNTPGAGDKGGLTPGDHCNDGEGLGSLRPVPFSTLTGSLLSIVLQSLGK